MLGGPFAELLARSVVIIYNKEKIAYAQLAPEIIEEPDYEDMLNSIRSL